MIALSSIHDPCWYVSTIRMQKTVFPHARELNFRQGGGGLWGVFPGGEGGGRARGHPPDVAAAVRFLVDAPFVTGQILYVDGGEHLP